MGSGGGIGIDIQSYKSMVTMTRVEVYDNMAALSGGGVVAQFGAPGSQVMRCGMYHSLGEDIPQKDEFERRSTRLREPRSKIALLNRVMGCGV